MTDANEHASKNNAPVYYVTNRSEQPEPDQSYVEYVKEYWGETGMYYQVDSVTGAGVNKLFQDIAEASIKRQFYRAHGEVSDESFHPEQTLHAIQYLTNDALLVKKKFTHKVYMENELKQIMKERTHTKHVRISDATEEDFLILLNKHQDVLDKKGKTAERLLEDAKKLVNPYLSQTK